MGTNIDAYRSVMVTVKEMCNLINGSNKVEALFAASAVDEQYEEIIKTSIYNVDEDKDNLEQFRDRMLSPLMELDPITVKVVRNIINEAVPVFYDGDGACHEYHDIWLSYWRYLLNIIAPDLPDPKSILYFRYLSLCGFDVPHRQPVLVFNAYECFEQKLTPAGEALRCALKRPKLDDILWSDMSY